MSVDHKLETEIVETDVPICKYLAFEPFKLLSQQYYFNSQVRSAPRLTFSAPSFSSYSYS